MNIKKDNWNPEEITEIRELYKLGYNAKEIGANINRTKGAVQKKIQELKRNEDLKVDKLILRQAEFLRRKKEIEEKEVLKAINYEGNKYMSDGAMVRKNPSAYISNKNGDKILDMRVNHVYAYDMPKGLINTGKREYGKTFKKLMVKGVKS